MSGLVLSNVTIVDGTSPQPRPGRHLHIEAGRIVAVSTTPLEIPGARVIDLAGRTLLPGLIDAHVHVNATRLDLGRLDETPATYLTAQASGLMRGMLERGFTTVRDAGGADRGLADAVADGLLVGPRLFVAGRALSQTGGHADFRAPTAITCACQSSGVQLGRIADGVDGVRIAARDELRKGAHQLKIMAGGGVASPTDPIRNTQYSEGEIRAIVEEAAACHTYVMAHAYVPAAIIRAVRCGVRSIEHGNLLDREAADAMAETGAFLVPTSVTYHALRDHGAELGLPRVSIDKLDAVLEVGLNAIELARSAGVKIGHGSDLLGECHRYQSDEFALKAQVVGNHEAIRQATEVNAELLGMAGELGVVAEGAIADLIAVDGNPLENITLLADQGRHLPLIIKDGEVFKNEIR